ncbi:MAG: rubrerythrin [Luteitalea sp.]|nr:rubrerythrin [Luteitalea sp.]
MPRGRNKAATLLIEDQTKRTKIIELLTRAYWMELETVMNYLSHSVNLDGVRAEEIKKNLAQDVTTELGHAQQFARRIKTLAGSTPGSFAFKPDQDYLQPTSDTTNVKRVIQGVIEAEKQAIAHYNQVIAFCDGVDYVTQDMVIQILGDEQEHLREFLGFLKEYEKS